MPPLAYDPYASSSLRPGVTRLTLVGGAERISLGWSEEAFEGVGLDPVLISQPFALETEAGDRVEVPAGIRIRVVGFEGAVRRSRTIVDDEGARRTSFSFELAPGTPVFTDIVPALGRRDRGGYRSRDRAEARGVPFVLSDSMEGAFVRFDDAASGRRGLFVFLAVVLGLALVFGIAATLFR